MVGKPTETIQNDCSTKDFISTPLVNPVVNKRSNGRFPLIPEAAENRSIQGLVVRLRFPVVAWSVFRRLWADAFSGGCDLPGLRWVTKAQKNPLGKPAGFN
jgi:hypothetical protein